MDNAYEKCMYLYVCSLSMHIHFHMQQCLGHLFRSLYVYLRILYFLFVSDLCTFCVLRTAIPLPKSKTTFWALFVLWVLNFTSTSATIGDIFLSVEGQHSGTRIPHSSSCVSLSDHYQTIIACVNTLRLSGNFDTDLVESLYSEE